MARSVGRAKQASRSCVDKMTQPFVVDRRLLGSQKHLRCDGDKREWLDNVPLGEYHLSGEVKPLNDRCMDTLLKLNNVQLDLSVQTEHLKMASTLLSGSSVSVLPWQSALSQKAHGSLQERIVSQAIVAMAQADRRYLEGTWEHGNTILRQLHPTCVNVDRFRFLEAERPHNWHAVETFRPHTGVTCNAVSYDRFGTLTGRCTVSSGPNVLVLKKEYRDLVASSYGSDGQVLSIDFSSLEPRVLLYEAGFREEGDMYDALAKKLGRERKAVKGAVISLAYGMSKHALGRVLDMRGNDLAEFIRHVRTYIGIDGLLERVKKQFMQDGYILNRYNRRVYVDEPLDKVFVNYYVQSTAADVALMGFDDAVNELKEACSLRPLFVLYDALIVDVHNDDAERVKQLKRVKVPGYVQRFPVTVGSFSRATG